MYGFIRVDASKMSWDEIKENILRDADQTMLQLELARLARTLAHPKY